MNPSRFSAHWYFILVLISGMLFLTTRYASADPETEIPKITVENASELVPLASLSGERESWMNRLLSTNERVLLGTLQPSMIWDTRTLNSTALPDGSVSAISPDGDHVLLTNGPNGTSLFTISSGNLYTLMPYGVNAAIFSPDNSVLLTSSVYGGMYQLWNTKTGDEITVLNSESMPVFSPNGHEMVLYDFDQSLKIWDYQKQQTRITVPSSAIQVFFTPDGARLIGYGSQRIEIWDVQTAQQLSAIDHLDPRLQYQHYNTILSPDGKKVLLSRSLWDVSNPHQIKSVTTFDKSPYDQKFQFSADSQSLAFWDADNAVINIVDTETGRLRTLIDYPRHLNKFAFSSDGQLLFTAGSDGLHGNDGWIQIWQWDGWVARLLTELPGYDFALSVDETMLVASISNSVVLAYGIPTAARPARPIVVTGRIVPSSINVRAKPASDAEIIGVASGQNVLVSGKKEGFFYLPAFGGWALSDPAYIQLYGNVPLSFLSEIDETVAIAQLPTSTPVMPTPTPQPTATLTPTLTPGPLPTLQFTEPTVTPITPLRGLTAIKADNLSDIALLDVLPIRMVGYPFAVSKGALSTDSRRLIAVHHWDKGVQIWDLTDFTEIPAAPLQESNLIVASSNGDWIAYEIHYDNQIRLWNVDEQKEVAVIQPNQNISEVVFSPDGSVLLVLQYGANPEVWDVATGTHRFTIAGNGAIAFSPDSRKVILVSRQGGFLRGYDLETGDRILQLDVGYRSVNDMFFSPDGELILLTHDQHVTVWDASGTFKTKLSGEFNKVVISPTGHLLATLEKGGRVRLWDTASWETVLTLDADERGGLAFSPNGRLLAFGNPLQLVDLQSALTVIPEGNFAASEIMFTRDGTSLLVQYNNSTMVLGIPTMGRPAWTPITGKVKPSMVNLRSGPDIDSAVIGYASGEVLISGRASSNAAVYLPDLKGWIWSDEDYLDLGASTLDTLPHIYVPPSP